MKLTVIFFAVIITSIAFAAGPEEFLNKERMTYMSKIEKADRKVEQAKKERDEAVLAATKDFIKDLEKVKVYWTKKGKLKEALKYQAQIDELQKMVDASKQVEVKPAELEDKTPNPKEAKTDPTDYAEIRVISGTPQAWKVERMKDGADIYLDRTGGIGQFDTTRDFYNFRFVQQSADRQSPKFRVIAEEPGAVYAVARPDIARRYLGKEWKLCETKKIETVKSDLSTPQVFERVVKKGEEFHLASYKFVVLVAKKINK